MLDELMKNHDYGEARRRFTFADAIFNDSPLGNKAIDIFNTGGVGDDVKPFEPVVVESLEGESS